ncbi:MAG: ABC transporter permease subunit [Proteobacteria bacterium]|nr:ABC transporter permease subunit [Pseudomonadota bacterium]MDA1356610.1 ABC transporter permease subunit [Pseudomonadota bacterium]
MTVRSDISLVAASRMPLGERIAQYWSAWGSATLGYTVLGIIYFPILWLIVLSVSGEPLTGFPGDWTLQWYDDMFYGSGQREGEAYGGNFRIVKPLLLSLLLAAITSIACMAAALAVGSVLPRIRRRGPFLMAFLMPLMVPGIVAGMSIFLFFRVGLHFKMGLWSLALAHFIWAFPFALLAMMVVASRFDQRLLEAASDLGASKLERFWQIEVPVLKPGIFAAGFFGFLLSFNELPFSIFMRAGQSTLPLYLWIQSGAHNTSVPLIFAMSTLITIASIFLTFVAIRVGFSEKK